MAWVTGNQLQGGRYTIERELGSGRFGITYLVKNRNSDRLVVKTLNDVVAWVWVLIWIIVGVVVGFMALFGAFGGSVVVKVGAGVGAVGMPGVVTLAVSRAKVVNFYVALVGAEGVAAGVGASILVILAFMSEQELQKSFTKFHTFLILAGTSAIGLALGWLGRWFLTQDYSLLKL